MCVVAMRVKSCDVTTFPQMVVEFWEVVCLLYTFFDVLTNTPPKIRRRKDVLSVQQEGVCVVFEFHWHGS